MYRRLRRAAVAVLVVGLLGLAWYRLGPSWAHLRTTYAQHECLSYAPPADQVVYEEDPAALATLLSRPNYRAAWKSAIYIPPCQVAYGWSFFRSDSPTLFLHERTSRLGVRKLVYVYISSHVEQGDPVEYYPFGLIEGVRPWVGSFDSSPDNPEMIANLHAVIGDGIISRIIEPRPAEVPHVRLFAGQPDPSDAARFTIGYEQWTVNAIGTKSKTQRGIIDGWLADEGNRVSFQRRRLEPQP